jgi:hypothetical protein
LDSSDLEKRFRQVIANRDSSECDDDQSVLSVLCATDWIRILVVCNPETDLVTIEIELSPPLSDSDSQQDRLDVELRFAGMIDHLNYLLRLGNIGFILKTSEEDCLWSASLPVKGELDSSIFQQMIPPVTQNIHNQIRKGGE